MNLQSLLIGMTLIGIVLSAPLKQGKPEAMGNQTKTINRYTEIVHTRSPREDQSDDEPHLIESVLP